MVKQTDCVHIQRIYKVLEKIKHSDISILIYGETGTGKEVFANYIHKMSSRKSRRHTKLNCSLFTHELFSSELFGYTKGAFTGANFMKRGLIELSHNGTLFLDEISTLEIPNQAKFLRILQEGEFYKLGSIEPQRCDFRLICASNVPLPDKTFRDDLYYRISQLEITLPPLRSRIQDLKYLCKHFLKKYQYLNKVRGIDADAMRILRGYSWPGNIRELENVLRLAILMAEPYSNITEGDLFRSLKLDWQGEIKMNDNELRLDVLERNTIRRAMRMTNGVQKDAAKLLGITPRVVHHKLKMMEKG